jgi:S1-C subfamily serine protease
MKLIRLASIFLAICISGTSFLPVHGQTANTNNTEFIGIHTIANLVEAMEPSVVNIVAITYQGTRLFKSKDDDRSKRLKRHYGLDDNDDKTSNYVNVTGSGVIVSPDGKILTNLHVVQNASNITVTLHNRENFTAKIIAKDNFSDLAILKIAKDNLPTIKFGDANKMRTGDWVVAIGNQFGLGHTVSHGLISGLKREAKGFASFGAKTGAVRFIQTDAPINPGSSGGPLLNLQGEVIGINTFIRDDAQNIGFAIPSNYAKEIADKLIASINIFHPYIGIEMLDPKESNLVNVQISKIRENSPAYKAGLKNGDLIITVNDKEIKNADDISQIVAKQAIGSSLAIKVQRGLDKPITVNVKVESLPNESE